KPARTFVPQHEGIFAAQAMHELGAEVLVEMQRDLAVGARAKAVAALLQFALDAFIIVELAIDDDPGALVFVGDGLIAGHQIDDAEPRMAEADAPMWRDPGALPVGTAMMEAGDAALERSRRNGSVLRENRDNAAHERLRIRAVERTGP